MTRPTPEQVHHAITRAEGWRFMGSETIMPGTGWEKFEVLAAEVLALREEAASENSEARRIFTREFKAELLERTQECDRLREDVARTPEIAQAAATLQRNVDTIAHNMVIAQRDEALATIARVEALGSGSGYRMGDTVLVTLGAVRAALKGGA